ncbi:hypothetical protein SISSUDRAFT_959977, partial [Sistotremastrum suecicum HHB10207 ss-3]
KTPCTWQRNVFRSQMEGKDMIVISATGSGKTLPIWMPLVFDPKIFLVVVCPLNAIADQHAKELNDAGIKALSMTRGT